MPSPDPVISATTHAYEEGEEYQEAVNLCEEMMKRALQQGVGDVPILRWIASEVRAFRLLYAMQQSDE